METTAQADNAGKNRVIIEAWDPVGSAPQRVLTDGSGRLQVAGSFSGGGDGAIVDGATPSIRASVLTAAPASDTGQPALAVRVISQLGAGSGGGGGNLATAAKGSTAAGSPTSEATNANIQALHVNVVNFPATQPISAVSLPLPAGAATETTLAAVNTKLGGTIAVSGTFWQATQPVSGTFWQATQPVSGPLTDTQLRATPVPVSNSSLPLPTGASTSAKQPALGTAGTPSADVITVQGIASMTALKVDGSAVTQPVSGTFWQATQAISAASLPLPTGAATESTLSTLNGKIPSNLTVTSTRLLTDGSGVTQPVSIAATVVVNNVPGTSGGLTPYHFISAASTNATNVKAAAGQLYGWYLYNANAAVRYFKLYNKATAPTVGTDTPVLTLPIPPGAAANVSFTQGIAFATGISFAITTGVADADTGAVAASEIVVNLAYA